jgi:Outer membrane protein beta-barrel domain
MSKPLWQLAAALSLVAVTPTVAFGDGDACDYCEQFPYKPLRMQIEGGRTITQGFGAQYLDNGMNVGLGLTWQPKAELPLALRVDGMYQRFDATQQLVTQAGASFGRSVDEGNVKMWGGDIDAEFYLKVSDWIRLNFLVGGGWYDEQNSFHYQGTLVSRNTTGTHFEKNAGLGLEFANGGSMFFFIDARYMRFNVNGQNLDLIPIRLGLRF